LDVVRAKRSLMAAGAQKKDVPKHLRGVDHALLDIRTELRVAVEQFHGIEILPWPCRLAQTGLWLMDHLMNMEASDELGEYYARLPLTQGASIVEANALRLDWNTVVPAAELSYIMGNPPFSGARLMNKGQKADMAHVFGDARGIGNLDYVTAWYRKAAEYMGDLPIRAAFVSTNSISQGEQVALLWKPLLGMGVHIQFGVPTFRWTNEGRGVAAVHCVIVGFGREGAAPNINPYLVEAPTVFIERRARPLCEGAPPMQKGNQPTDGGNLIIEAEDYEDFMAREPRAAPFVRPLMGAEEFINNKPRWCLWLVGASPADLRKMPLVMERVEKVRQARLASPKAATRKSAKVPALFQEIRQPDTDYLVVPSVSSEQRDYIPIGFLGVDTIPTNLVLTVPSASPWHFGILTSSAHNAWARATCGRLEMRYRYSKDVVYNNFPWPEATEEQKGKIAALAQGVLDARNLFPGSSLADLYDPRTTPPELLKAHRALDAAVMRLYGFPAGMAEAEVVAGLMERYARLAGGVE
jgi:hypothetical protein